MKYAFNDFQRLTDNLNIALFKDFINEIKNIIIDSKMKSIPETLEF
jgi:hypothetical protein